MEKLNNFSQFLNYQEMEDHHIKRLNYHISLVKKYLWKIIELDLDEVDNNILVDELKNHDLSKFIEPELSPYVIISWFYKCKAENKDFTMTDDQKLKTDEATMHHIKNNKHHPEFWTDNQLNLINREDRDKIERLIDATKMPLEYICSMCADWLAMSEEKNSNPLDWADKMINKRWKFTKDQSDLIYKILIRFKLSN